MTTIEPQTQDPTRVVFNQPPPLEGYNLYLQNRPLMEAAHREGAGWAEERLITMGQEAGGEPIEWGRLANGNTPVLRTHDRYGNRIDPVEFPPPGPLRMELSGPPPPHAHPWSGG